MKGSRHAISGLSAYERTISLMRRVYTAAVDEPPGRPGSQRSPMGIVPHT